MERQTGYDCYNPFYPDHSTSATKTPPRAPEVWPPYRDMTEQTNQQCGVHPWPGREKDTGSPGGNEYHGGGNGAGPRTSPAACGIEWLRRQGVEPKSKQWYHGFPPL